MVAISTLVFASTAYMCVLPAVDQIYAAFPGQTFWVNAFISSPTVLACLSNLACPMIMKRWDDKQVIMAATTLATIAGGMLALFSSLGIIFMTAMCLLFSLSAGLLSAGAVIIINDYFADEEQRTKALTFYTTSMTAVSILSQTVAGKLAAIHWSKALYTYLLCLIPLVMISLFVPSAKAMGIRKYQPQESVEAKKTGSASLGKRFWGHLLVLFFMYLCTQHIWAYYISVFVSENALGDASIAGYLSTTRFAAALSSAIFAVMMKKFGKNTGFLIFLTGLLAISLLYFGRHSLVLVFLSAILDGFCLGLIYPYSLTLPSYLVPEEKQAFAVSVSIAIPEISGGVISYIATALIGVCSGLTRSLPIYIAITVICCIAEWVMSRSYPIGQE